MKRRAFMEIPTTINPVFNCYGLRRRLGLTQAEMALKIGASERSYRRWEQDGVAPRGWFIRKLKAIEAALNERVAEHYKAASRAAGIDSHI